MPICSKCGQTNEATTDRCTRCGIALGHQMRAQADTDRRRTMIIFKVVAWIAVIGIIVFVGPGVYHSANGAYLNYHLESVRAGVTSSCGGPITDKTYPFEKDQIEKCIAENQDLIKAQQDLDAFNKPSK